MNYYPYNTKDSSMLVNSDTPIKNNYDQLDLAPYLPQLSKEAHILLAQAHMELANNMEGTTTTGSSIENMNNIQLNGNINDKILGMAHMKAVERFKNRLNKI